MSAKKELQCQACEVWFATRKAAVPRHNNKSGTGQCGGSERPPRQTRDAG